MKTEMKLLDAEMLEQADIPEAFWHFDIDTYAGSQRALKDCHTYCTQYREVLKHNTGLFIRGEADSQKTFLAVYVLKYMLSLGLTVRYVSMPDLVDKVMSNDIRLRDFLKLPSFVVIDNLSAESNSFYATALNRALTVRRDCGKPTICVTQLLFRPQERAGDQFAAIYGEANLRLIQSLSHTVEAEMGPTQHAKLEQQRKQDEQDLTQ